MDECPPDSAVTPPERAWAQFDLALLRRNLSEIQRRVGRPVDVIASVKADAYGHGAVPVARALESVGVFALATGSLSEAIEIRRASVETPILLFPGFLPNAVPSILEYGITPGIDRLELANKLSALASTPVSVWLKVDGGLGRHGVVPADVVAFVEALRALPRVDLAGVFTHLPFVDQAGRGWAKERLVAFTSVLRALEQRDLRPPHSQALSSAGALAGLDDPSSAICPGHALYGIAPAAPEVMSMTGFEPVARAITGVLAHIAPHRDERTIGVGGTRHLPEGATTGVASLGRRDGYRWRAEEAASMLVRGTRASVIGLSLEHVMLDLTDIPAARPGDRVVALGSDGDDSIGLAELAAWRGSTPVETLLDFAGRIGRRYTDEAGS